LPYSEYMGDLFGTVLVTPKALLASNPDVVRRFTGALLRGLVYGLEHPEEAGVFLHNAEPAQDAALGAEEMRLMRAYALPGRGERVGSLNPPRVERAIALLRSVGLIPASGLTGELLVRFDLLDQAPVVA